MSGQPLIEIPDLLAKIFLLQLEQRLGITFFDAADEQRHEAPEKIGDPTEHLRPHFWHWFGRGEE